jgi:AraC-like DNA-binding protein
MIDVIDLFNACLYIQDNLDADLSLLFLAQTVGLSRFRFHRVFKAWRGETLHDFVTRMRMQRAAFELAYPVPRSSRRSIKAIAFASGYKSLSSFSHAFSSYAQLSPREYRNRALRTRPMLRRDQVDTTMLGPFRISVSDEPARQIAIFDPVTRAGDALAPHARHIVADTVGTSGARYGVELLPNLFVRSRRERPTTSRVSATSCIGAEIDDWRRVAPRRGRDGDPVPRSIITLDAGRYAVVRGEGSITRLYRAWLRHFDAWLAAGGECPRSARVYMRFDPARANSETFSFELFIPLESLPPSESRAPSRHRGLVRDRANSGEPIGLGVRHTDDCPALQAGVGH